jgi:hypothetical protein
MSRISLTTLQFENDVSVLSTGLPPGSKERITIEEKASSLSINRVAVYALLNRCEIPAIRLGRRWIVTRNATSSGSGTCRTKT